jgi:hypothetical protein
MPCAMLWLDTAIYIDLAKIEVGELTHSDPRHNLLTTLREIVLSKVEEGSLSAPKMNRPRRSRESVEGNGCGVHCVPSTGVKKGLPHTTWQTDTSAILCNPHCNHLAKLSILNTKRRAGRSPLGETVASPRTAGESRTAVAGSGTDCRTGHRWSNHRCRVNRLGCRGSYD